MAPWATGGVCLTFLAGPGVTDDQVRSAYLPADLTRLDRIQREFHRTNTFRISRPMAAGR